MAHILSDNISIFPLAKNRTSDRGARLFYEHNIANIIRQLTDVQGFIISPTEEEFNQSVNKEDVDTYVRATAETSNNLTKLNLIFNKDFIFNLYGYYFHIKGNPSSMIPIIIDPTKDIVDVYASLTIDGVTGEIKGQDEVDLTNTSIYSGLTLDKEPLANCTASLKLLTFTKHGNDWTPVTTSESYMKLSGRAIDFSINRIDGKH